MGSNLRSSDFYVTGGTMLPDAPSYVERPGDRELEEAVLRGEYCYVLTSRQMGKSSLMARTAAKLRQQKIVCAIVDLTRMDSANADPMVWYAGIIDRIHRDLELRFDLRKWLRDHDYLGPVRRFTEYLGELASQNETPAVIFVDEIDSTIPLPFGDDFFAAVRACFNARATEPVFRRITFVLLGAATPPQLIRNPARTPFNVGRQITLDDLPRDEAMAKLAFGLHPAERRRRLLFERIYHWTAGHPYLTQKLCAEVAARAGSTTVDQIVAELFFAETARDTELHLKTTADRLRASGSDALQLYARILSGADVEDQPASPEFMALRLTGVVRSDAFGHLRVRNRIYQTVFTGDWAVARVPTAPRGYISSTSEDLTAYREAARDAAIAAGFQPYMVEYFTTSGDHLPYEFCMDQVGQTDILIAIVAHRYGWVPADQPPPGGKSITWLECEQAVRQGKEVLAFLVDEGADWPLKLRESYRITEAIESGSASVETFEEARSKVAKLRQFKQWLNQRGIRASFATPDDLKIKVLRSLQEWRERHPTFKTAPLVKKRDPSTYLEQLREDTGWIDIRGLQVGSGKAHRFAIDQLYIPLTGTGLDSDARAVHLEEALQHRRLVVTGDPGSGKTTFLRRLAFALSQSAGNTPQIRAGFPILIRLFELADHMQRSSRRSKESPAWFAEFLGQRSEELRWNLDAAFFEQKLRDGTAVLLLDGLDEMPDRMTRDAMARLIDRATLTYPDCRFVVTTRPGAYIGDSVLTDFEEMRLGALEEDAISHFLERWSRALFPDSPMRAADHSTELLEALRSRPEILRMAQNPVMLTALAVVYWNERHLPEQRADLYESVLIWLARARERRPGREPAERCLALFQSLALAMQVHENGRLTRMPKDRAAGVLAPEIRNVPKAERYMRALSFLEEEETDSGIIVSRGSEIQFWHMTFQEYLAARAIAGLREVDQDRLLLDRSRVYEADWREVVLLLAGILRVRQGHQKVDALFESVLNNLGRNPSLAQQARCVGLLGAIVRDLRVFGYEASDPRYRTMLESVLGMFDPAGEKVAFKFRLEAAEALGEAGDPRIVSDNWITIPASEFQMSAQDILVSEPNDDLEAISGGGAVQYLNPYQIGRYPVTVQEYRRFVEAGGYYDTRWWSGGGFGYRSEPQGWHDQMLHPNRPVVGVSWYEAAAYCAWAGVRLPTEAEWQRAACGEGGRKYPWGNEEPDQTRANFSNNVGHATPVGLYPHGATPEGVQDLGGNVWEWVANPLSEDKGILYGGSWRDTMRSMRTASRLRLDPAERFEHCGFRGAR